MTAFEKLAVAAFMILWIALAGGIGFVAVHFIMKLW